MSKYLTHNRCKVCGERLYRTSLNERLYCKNCYKYIDDVMSENELVQE